MDYVICYTTSTGDTWEGINGEDAMQIRVSEICDTGLDPADIMVFPKAAEIDLQPNEDCEITRHLIDIVDNAVALAGYKIINGFPNTVCVRHLESRRPFEIKVTELVD